MVQIFREFRLYDYIISEIRKEKIEILYSLDVSSESTFINAYIESMYYMLKWAKEHPKYYQIGLLMEKDTSLFIKKHRDLTSLGLNRFKEMIRIDQVNGEIREELDADIILDIIVSAGLKIASKYISDEELFIRKILKMLDIVTNGIRKVD